MRTNQSLWMWTEPERFLLDDREPKEESPNFPDKEIRTGDKDNDPVPNRTMPVSSAGRWDISRGIALREEDE